MKRSRANFGFVAVAAESAAAGPVGLVIGGIISGIFALRGLFGQRGHLQKFGRELHPPLHDAARRTNLPVITWWFGDLIKVDPNGTTSILGHFADVTQADSWLHAWLQSIAGAVLNHIKHYDTDEEGNIIAERDDFEKIDYTGAAEEQPSSSGDDAPLDTSVPPSTVSSGAPAIIRSASKLLKKFLASKHKDKTQPDAFLEYQNGNTAWLVPVAIIAAIIYVVKKRA